MHYGKPEATAMNMHSIQIMECNIVFVDSLTRVFGKMELMSLVFITMYVLKVSSIIAEDTVNFIALIVNRNNPNIDRIIDDFDEFIGFFNHKPE